MEACLLYTSIAKDGVDLSAFKGLTDQIKVEDKLYELPFRSDFWVVFYNKDIFDAAGVDYPTNDMTFEQYDALARSVTNDMPGQEVYGCLLYTSSSISDWQMRRRETIFCVEL